MENWNDWPLNFECNASSYLSFLIVVDVNVKGLVAEQYILVYRSTCLVASNSAKLYVRYIITKDQVFRSSEK